MPAKPGWLLSIPDAISQLEQLDPFRRRAYREATGSTRTVTTSVSWN